MRKLTLTALATLATTLGALAVTAVPALAAAPEAPVTETPSPLGGTTATLKGELNPKAGVTTKVAYHFAYNQGSECMGGPTAPAEPFPEAEGEKKHVTAPVTGLVGSTEYTVCLIAANPANAEEATEGSTVHFTTLASKPVVSEGSESSSEVKTHEARLGAVVNPENQETECHFQYGKETGPITENEVPCETEKITEFYEQGVGVNISDLAAATKYHYRVVVKNATGKNEGAEAEFETVRPPSELETGVAEEITTTSANINKGKLDAGGEATYYIEYGTAPCTATSCGAKSGEAVSGSRSQEELGPIALSALKPDTVYHYWLVATNGAGGPPVHGAAGEFKTLLAGTSQLETGEAQAVTTTSAQLGGEVNPGGEAQYYIEYGPGPCAEKTTEHAASCGTRTATSTVTGTSEAPVAPFTVSGLQPNTAYYYWLVVENAATGGPQHGDAHVFRTAKTPEEQAAEAATARRPGEELAAAVASQSALEAETARQAAATAAAAAAANKRYEEVNAVNARTKSAEEAVERAQDKTTKTPVKAVKKCAKEKKLKGTKCVKAKKAKKKMGKKK